MSLLEVSDLHTFYGETQALRGVSFRVEPGEIVALLGSNGAGKTTTLRTISRLEKARQGSVVFKGQDITGMAAHRVVALGIGHVPEGRRIFPGLTVEENISLGGYLMRRRRAALEDQRREMRELFPHLAERRGQLAGTLSGGEQQMLAIARALMCKPTLLALDEPSMGLAPMVTRTVLRAIARIRDHGTAILMVEQNARQALRLADRAYVLEGGRITLEGKASELAEDPRVQAAYLGGSPADQKAGNTELVTQPGS